jgi:high-affinity iron transporter
VLFFVSYWLISKSEAAKWQRYIQGKVKTAVATGSGLALASAAFLAVYREGVETVLFYQALLASSGEALTPVAVGFAAGLLGLTVLYLLFLRFGMRLPIRQFFLATSVLLYYLSFVFAGKGVAELQEAGWISMTPVPGLPRIEFIGLYPTVETLLVQGVLLVCLVYAIAVTLRGWRRAAPQVDATAGEVGQLRELVSEIRRELGKLAENSPGGPDQTAALRARVVELEEQMSLQFPANGRAKA